MPLVGPRRRSKSSSFLATAAVLWARVERFAAAESLTIIEELPSSRLGKGADALDTPKAFQVADPRLVPLFILRTGVRLNLAAVSHRLTGC
jgi:hypothetical protein